MNTIILKIQDVFVQISSILMTVLGGLLLIALLVWLIGFGMNWIYKQMKASIYFVSFIRHRKEFIVWFKQNHPDKIPKTEK